METWAKVLIVVMAALNGLVLLLNAGLKKYVEEKVTHLATKEDLADLVKEVREKAVASKEGEIAAIQNKLDTVVEQNRAIVLSSEEIKRQVSGRQRMWELKRELAHDILKITGSIGHLFTLISSASKTIRKPDTSEPYRLKLHNDLGPWQARFDESLEALWQLEATSQIYYDSRIAYALQRLTNAGAGLHATSVSDSDNDRLTARNEFTAVRTEVIGLLQEQLKADDESPR
jgi:hypothetical protein